MKHGKVISIKNSMLKNLRNNLRKVIAKAQYQINKNLTERDIKIMQDYDLKENKERQLDHREIIRM